MVIITILTQDKMSWVPKYSIDKYMEDYISDEEDYLNPLASSHRRKLWNRWNKKVQNNSNKLILISLIAQIVRGQ